MKVFEPPANTGFETIRRYAELACQDGDAETAARAWTEAGFDDEMTARWLQARCFDPEAARALAELGVTPEQANRPYARRWRRHRDDRLQGGQL